MRRKDGVFGAVLASPGQCQALATRAIYNSAEIWQDGSYFSDRFTEQASIAYKASGDNALYEFRICVYNAIVAAMNTQCSGMGAPSVCFDYKAADKIGLGNRLAILAARAKNITASQSLLSTTPKLVSSIPLAKAVSVVTRSGVGTKPVPPIVVPMPRPAGTPPTVSNEVSLVEKSAQGYTYVAASDVDSAGIIATLSIGGAAGNKVTGTKDFSGAHWSVINSNITADSADPAALLSGLVANGDGLVMTADSDSVYITGTKYIDQAAILAPSGQTEVFVLLDPASGWLISTADAPAPTSDGTPPSSTGLYIGIGVGIVAVGGLVAYLATRKK